jgi:hypothetical protein
VSLLSLVLPVLKQPDKTEDPKINTAFTTIQTWANGNIESSNVKPESLAAVSLSKGLGGAVSGETSAAPYTARTEVTINTNHKGPSTTRPAWANIGFQMTAQSGFGIGAQLFLGGVLVEEWFVAENTVNGKAIPFSTAVWLGAGEEWQLKSAFEGGGAKVGALYVAYRGL